MKSWVVVHRRASSCIVVSCCELSWVATSHRELSWGVGGRRELSCDVQFDAFLLLPHFLRQHFHLVLLLLQLPLHPLQLLRNTPVTQHPTPVTHPCHPPPHPTPLTPPQNTVLIITFSAKFLLKKIESLFFIRGKQSVFCHFKHDWQTWMDASADKKHHKKHYITCM